MPGQRIHVLGTPDDVASAVARHVADALRTQPRLVLGLPAGRTPVGAYAELGRLHASGMADFAHATTFNVDEFAGIPPSHPGSFKTFMDRHLFRLVNLAPERIQFLDGAAPDLDRECERYETAIEAAGGIGLQLLGIGTNGHIGFNEPADHLQGRTHRVTLAASTRRDNAALFGDNPAEVPAEALSMGMGTILKACSIVLIATGERKAECLERAVRGPISTRVPASFLQVHRAVEIFADREAAARLRSA
jgi:glucosamine-6-phosphate deaminase